MIIKPRTVAKGGMHLASGTTKELTTSFSKIAGTWTDGVCCGFTITDGELVCLKGGIFLFNGESSLSTSTAGRVEYALFINDNLVTGSETPADFASSSKNSSMGITTLLSLAKYDRIAIYAKADDTMTITIALLKITCWGE